MGKSRRIRERKPAEIFEAWALAWLVLLSGCAAPQGVAESTGELIQEEISMKMKVQVGGSAFTATLEKNPAAAALADRLEAAPMVIQMEDYAGFEKVGGLGVALPASDSQTTTRPGDIVLYCGDQIVMFYGANTWSYTRLGHIDDLDGWAEALGSGDVTVTLSLDEE